MAGVPRPSRTPGQGRGISRLFLSSSPSSDGPELMRRTVLVPPDRTRLGLWLVILIEPGGRTYESYHLSRGEAESREAFFLTPSQSPKTAL